MSAPKEVFTSLPVLLRSTTPVVSEKVLIWHQKMQEEEPLPPERDKDQSEPDTTPPDPVTWQPEPFHHHQILTHAPTARTGSSPNSAKILEDLAASKSGVDYAGVAEVEEAESNVQERSQIDARSRRSSINIRSVHPEEDITPSPAPKHLSHDTVPSFGNLDASMFDAVPQRANFESTPAWAAQLPLPVGLQTPSIKVQAPTDPDASQRNSKHPSRAASRVSNVRIDSVHESESDAGTARDEADARTVPVETARAPSHAASTRTRSVAHSHHPSERDGPMSPTSVKTSRSRVSVKSPPPHSVKSHGLTAKSGVNSAHPSQMPLPSSADGATAYEVTPTQRTVPLYAPSNHAASQRAPSNYAPSQHQPSQYAPSQRAPSKAPTVASSKAPTVKEPSHHAPSEHAPSQHAPSQHAPSQQAPSQHAPSVHGSVQGGQSAIAERREPSLHPMSNHPGAPASFTGGGSHYGGGSKYGASQQGGGGQSQVPSTPSLHPLTQHLQQHPPGSHRPSSRLGRAQSPYGPIPTADDFLHAVVRGRAISPTPSNPHGHPQSIQSAFAQTHNHNYHEYGGDTPTQSRPQSPDGLNAYEQQMVDEVLVRTPRTSYTVTPSALAAEVHNSHFHDEDLCILLHAADDEYTHDVVKKAVRKAIRGRVKKLGLKHENDALRQYASPGGSHASHRHHHHQHHQHQPLPAPQSPDRVVVVPMHQEHQDPPSWAKDMMMIMQETRERLESLERKKKSSRSYAPTESMADEGTLRPLHSRRGGTSVTNDLDGASPITVTIPINTPARTGTVLEESVLNPGETEFTRAGSERGAHTMGASEHHHDGSEHIDGEQEDDYPDEYETGTRLRESANNTPPTQDGEAKSRQALNRLLNSESERDDSPGQQILEEEIYKLRVKPSTRSEHSHRTWEIQQDDDAGTQPLIAESEAMPEIPDTEGSRSELQNYDLERKASPPLPALPVENRESGVQAYPQGEWPGSEPPAPPPWQRIHQRLLNWAIVWPMSELDQALNSTTRGHQVDEVALSIWSTQTYKRYVRARLTDHPPMRIDRLFIPPNVADAINSAVYNGRHGDACGMLRDMWTPFGLDGMPRLLLVLCKHRREENHWVAHRFSLPDGTLTTYDSYPERSLPDGRPLGWWFAIRIAWPHAMYPSPDHLAQRMVRIHRPMQLGVDNSVATAGIWRNLLMGSKAERSIDLERLRDLVNTEVKNLRQRKDMGKLSITAPRPNWEEIS